MTRWSSAPSSGLAWRAKAIPSGKQSTAPRRWKNVANNRPTSSCWTYPAGGVARNSSSHPPGRRRVVDPLPQRPQQYTPLGERLHGADHPGQQPAEAVQGDDHHGVPSPHVVQQGGRPGRRTPRTASANGIDTDSRVTPGPPGPEGDVGDSPIRVVLEPDGKAAFHPPDMGALRVEGVAGTVLSSKSASDDDVVARVEELIRLHANHPGTAPVLEEGRPDVVHHAGGTVPGAAVGHPRARLHPLDVGSESLARRREICAVEVPVGVAQQR